MMGERAAIAECARGVFLPCDMAAPLWPWQVAGISKDKVAAMPRWASVSVHVPSVLMQRQAERQA